MTDAGAGHRALAHVERVLEQRPKKDDHELSHATRCLAEFREELIRRSRAQGAVAGDYQRLARINAIVSVVMGMHFPIGNAPWGELEKAYGWLKDLVEETEHVGAAGA